MSIVDRLDDLWNAIADRLGNKGETEWTEVAGIVTAKRVDGQMTDYPEYFIRVSQTELEVSSGQFDSAAEGQQVVLYFRGASPITRLEELRHRKLFSVTLVGSEAALERLQVADLEEIEATAVQTRRARDLEAKKATETRRKALDLPPIVVPVAMLVPASSHEA